ncbi:MAG TPA: hypothetical protein VFD38_01385 [Myxococcaceae bacterium]|nr:hypothetical protein [Myxococcaceae bacterium]
MQVVAQLSMQDLPDDVRVLSLRAREALSEPFEVSVRLVCADPGLPPPAGRCARGSVSGRETR